MSVRVLALTLVASAALAGCGPSTPKEGQAAVDVRTGTATVNLGGGAVATVGAQAPANLPAYAAVYPGAQVQSAVTGISGDAKGGMLAISTADSADKVIAFYKQAATEAGLTVKGETTQGALRMLSARKDDQTLTVTVVPQGGSTMAQLTYR